MEGDYPSLTLEQLFSRLNTSQAGLTQKQAKERLKSAGLNQITKQRTIPVALKILLAQFKNWLILVLLAAAGIAFLIGEQLDALIVTAIVILSVVFSFYQEYRTEKTVEKLKKFISHKVNVKREGEWFEIDSKRLVVGDLVKLQVGEIVPADIRLTNINNFSVNEAVLTGESLPVAKQIVTIQPSSQPQELKNMALMGTAVASGYAEGIVVAIGNQTVLGKTANYLDKTTTETDFQKEIRQFSTFLFRLILIMTIFIFGANAYLNKGVFDSFLFALALAVGITPELLPAILTVTLSHGALKMAKKDIVVKRLISVEDFGNIDTLCMDKTGTLTQGTFTLVKSVNENGLDDQNVLLKGLLCTSHFAQPEGLTNINPIDQALWTSPKAKPLKNGLKDYKLLAENEFDFTKRRMSVLVETNNRLRLIAKGAPDFVLPITNLTPNQQNKLLKKAKSYEESGFRVIAVAEREIPQKLNSRIYEKDLIFSGFLLFSDPVKPKIKESLDLFQKLGVKIKILSGDSLITTQKVAQEVGLKVNEDEIILGEELNKLPESKLEEIAQKYDFFARVTPEQKYKIVASLNKEGHIVGFLGDGVNDAPALKAADVGIAVDSSTAVAKEAADIILLKKDLAVLADGIELGRKTFGNIMKYILNTISANFGNMLTVALSSLFLRFIPLLPKQILLTNFISDIPLFAIATDNVDEQFTKKPKRWNLKLIGKFMLYFGLISSIFDLALILPMSFLWQLPTETFRTAWFVESTLSEIIVTLSIRTKLAFYQSLPSKLLLGSSIISGSVVLLLLFLDKSQTLFGFTHLPAYLWVWIGLVLASYFLVTEIAKHFFLSKNEL